MWIVSASLLPTLKKLTLTRLKRYMIVYYVYAILDIASIQVELECEEKGSGDNETFVEVC